MINRLKCFAPWPMNGSSVRTFLLLRCALISSDPISTILNANSWRGAPMPLLALFIAAQCLGSKRRYTVEHTKAEKCITSALVLVRRHRSTSVSAATRSTFSSTWEVTLETLRSVSWRYVQRPFRLRPFPRLVLNQELCRLSPF